MSARELAERGSHAPPSAVSTDVLNLEHMRTHHKPSSSLSLPLAHAEESEHPGRAVFALDDEEALK